LQIVLRELDSFYFKLSRIKRHKRLLKIYKRIK
jgi:hypothetical protein